MGWRQVPSSPDALIGLHAHKERDVVRINSCLIKYYWKTPLTVRRLQNSLSPGGWLPTRAVCDLDAGGRRLYWNGNSFQAVLAVPVLWSHLVSRVMSWRWERGAEHSGHSFGGPWCRCGLS